MYVTQTMIHYTFAGKPFIHSSIHSYGSAVIKTVSTCVCVCVCVSSCRHCMKEPHEPCCCELWEKWKDLIQRMTNS